MYALMGAGLHGLNGILPNIAYTIYDIYVIPRVLSGMEATLISPKDMAELEKFHRNILRMLQHLPARTPNAAVYLLLGAWPIEAQLDMRYLSLFGSICRRFGSKIRRLAERQCIMKDVTSYSWFSKITILLYKYNLSSPLDILTLAPNKEPWKKICKQAVKSFWVERLTSELKEKPSLRYINSGECSIGKPHLTWANTTYSTRDVRRSTIKMKLLTGTYMLQGNRAVWDVGSCRNTKACCPLCHSAPENRSHFILQCSSLHHVRDPYITLLVTYLQQHSVNCQPILNSEDLLLQLILDCTHPKLHPFLNVSCDVCSKNDSDACCIDEVERISQRLCYALHYKRAQLLTYRP
jgi:hypothetical protein